MDSLQEYLNRLLPPQQPAFRPTAVNSLLQTRPEAQISTPENFVRTGFLGDSGRQIANQLGLLGLGFAPGAGFSDYAGTFPSAQGGTETGFQQNISQGNYLTAVLQGLGAAGDAATLSAAALGPFAPVAAGLGTIAKAPRAAQRVVKGLIDAVQPPPGSVMPQANEMLPIFHGTSPESAKAIQQSGFDVTRSADSNEVTYQIFDPEKLVKPFNNLPTQRGLLTDEKPAFTTKQEGNVLKVEPTGVTGQPQQIFGKNAGEGVYPGTVASARGNGLSVYGVSEQEANREIQSFLNKPETNKAFQIANTLAEQNLGRPYDLQLSMPSSSLPKQSGIGRAYEIASEMPDKYPKDTIFESYLNDPEYGPVIKQKGIKNYDDLVEQSYKQLETETSDQFGSLPIKMSFHEGDLNYLDSGEMLRDILGHNHLTVFRGGDAHEFLNKIDSQTGLNSNEQFRAVHDYFGHAIKGNSFGPKGEEIAWASHQQMYSPLARLAMTSETRGQNSFVNYTPVNAELYKEMEDLRKFQYEAKRKGDIEEFNSIGQTLRELGGKWGYAKQASIILPPEFTKVDFSGGIPDYLATAAPAKFPSQEEIFTHFSRSPDIIALDPQMYGTGIKGAERSRLSQTEQPIVPRTFMYRGDSPIPEAGLGLNRYQTQTGGFYDVSQDPERLSYLSFVKNRMPASEGPYGGIYGADQQAQSLTDLERLAYQYGYKGLLDSNKAVSFQPVPVKRVR